MVGKYKVIVENTYIKYEFILYRNITVIRGQSATGKTTLVEMIRSHNENEDSGVMISSAKQLTVLYGREWKRDLEYIQDSIVFIDEQSRFVKSREFADAIRGTDNYYVIVTREKLSELPYSITEIYGIRSGGKYAGLTGEYSRNEFYRIYGCDPIRQFRPDIIITEDSNSGYDFWDSISDHIRCSSANGKSNVLNILKTLEPDDLQCLTVVDGAAFGPEMEAVMQYIKFSNRNIEIYAPESFEYMILTSGLFTEKSISEKCDNTYDYADSREYMSWEQFYSALLTSITADSERRYSKGRLNSYYLSEKNIAMIMKNIPDNLELG